MKKIKIVHYINQFFGQIGGEEEADIGVIVKEGAIGPGNLINNLLINKGEIVKTIVCGDNYFTQNPEDASEKVLNNVKKLSPDVFIAGPAFSAGRYGLACGEACKKVNQELGIPTITGMFENAPATEIYKKDTYIVKTGDSAKYMRNSCESIVNLLIKIFNDEYIDPQIDDYIPRGIRKNVISDYSASTRAIDALLKRIRLGDSSTEVKLPNLQGTHTPASPVKALNSSCVALITTGGIVPLGNPEKLKAHASVKYGKYSIANIDDLSKESFEGHHGGYFNGHINEDPDRMVPVDTMRLLEKEGFVGKLFDYIYTFAGTGTSPEDAEKFTRSISVDLKKEHVDAVLITST